MIAVTRSAPPHVLQQHGADWSAALQAANDELERLKNDPQATPQQLRRAKRKKQTAQNKYRHREIKDALVAMFHGKCAYCESQIRAVAYGHIEHFYPKSTYVDKTFEWDNLLLACEICNGPGHKGDDFPLDADGNPLLIDPTDGVTEPSAHLTFSWDPQVGLAYVYGRDARGKEVVRTFDLNGERGRDALLRERSQYLKKLWVILRLYEQRDGEDEEARAILQAACQPDAPYSAFALANIAPRIS